MAAPHPLDDDPPAGSGVAHAPQRTRRRPWWRWNLVTLLAALFVTVWVRELGRVGASGTWSLVLSIFIAWGCGPLLFVSPDCVTDSRRRRRRWWARLAVLLADPTVVLLRAVAVVGMVTGALVLVGLFAAFQFSSHFSSQFQGQGLLGLMQLVWFGMLPMLGVLGGAGVYAITEVAFRLGPPPPATPPVAPPSPPSRRAAS